MTDAFKEPDRAEAEAHRITESSNAEVHEYFHRGIKERWLSGVVHNRLEQRPPKHNLVRRALQRLGFSVSKA
jgi:hypothetical protein